MNLLQRILPCLLALAFSCHAAERPNIILIYTDDHGWPDIGIAGVNDDLRTPNLDKLAADGVYATSGYSTAPQCVPSRAGIMIGKSQNRFGVESNGASLDGFDAELTIAERLKKAGYATGQIGKWHLGPSNKITDHGFDDVYAKNSNRPCHANYTLAGETIKMQIVNDRLYHLDACSEAARAFIKRHRQQPFFLYLAYRAPHVPLDAPQKYLSRFPGKMPERRRQALAMIAAMDDGVGMIRQTLSELGLEKNTLIFYIGDNGAPLKIHKLDAPGGGPGWDGSLNHPMNGEKGMLSEGGIRVPFVVAYPGTIPGGQIYQHPVISLDVAATAVALAGLPKEPGLDGVNLIPFLSGKRTDAPHENLRWRWISQAAIRAGDWKFLKGGKREYLFDLKNDREEKSNLLHSEPEITRRLRAKLSSWADELQPPGLATAGMSTTWEQYFDFYLDGKEPAPLREKFRPAKSGGDANATGDTQGWIGRNSSVLTRGNSLVVNSKAAKPPFIVQSRLKVTGSFVAKIRLQTAADGNVGIAWRLSDQKDFGEGQIRMIKVNATSGWQDIAIPIPTDGTVIHARLHLPTGETKIQQIEFENQKGRTLSKWQFGK
jgi:arylsulfatase A-like enzyme